VKIHGNCLKTLKKTAKKERSFKTSLSNKALTIPFPLSQISSTKKGTKNNVMSVKCAKKC
jgi:hypothetical protein